MIVKLLLRSVEDKDFAEVVSHFSGVMDLKDADDMDDCFCLV